MSFELGPIQEKWLKSLEEHPERQMPSRLGKRYDDTVYKACCLGEGGLIAGICEWNGNNKLYTIGQNPDDDFLTEVYVALGLRSPYGSHVSANLQDENIRNHPKNLSVLNDNEYSWPQIAAIIRENPEDYFTKSV